MGEFRKFAEDAATQTEFDKVKRQNKERLAKYIKDAIDDPDAIPGYIFNRFFADCMFMDKPIEWEDML